MKWRMFVGMGRWIYMSENECVDEWDGWMVVGKGR